MFGSEVTPSPTPLPVEVTPTPTPLPLEVIPTPLPLDAAHWVVLSDQLDTLTWAVVGFGVLALILLGILAVKALS